MSIAHEIISRLEYFDLVGQEIAFKVAENYRKLRSKGITIRKKSILLSEPFVLKTILDSFIMIVILIHL
jgi:hypothetical protein